MIQWFNETLFNNGRGILHRVNFHTCRDVCLGLQCRHAVRTSGNLQSLAASTENLIQPVFHLFPSRSLFCSAFKVALNLSFGISHWRWNDDVMLWTGFHFFRGSTIMLCVLNLSLRKAHRTKAVVVPVFYFECMPHHFFVLLGFFFPLNCFNSSTALLCLTGKCVSPVKAFYK